MIHPDVDWITSGLGWLGRAGKWRCGRAGCVEGIAVVSQEIDLSLGRRFARVLRWTRSSYVILGSFVATLFVIGVVWWPLAERELAYIDWNRPLWGQVDWLLVFDFAVMSVLIMAGANLKTDLRTVFIGLCGGLVIESWGTQTELWRYYTLERPPLWIIPAWPIAALSVDRLARLLRILVDQFALPRRARLFRVLYWVIFTVFYVALIVFAWPAITQSLTLLAVLLCTLFILTPTDHAFAVLTFLGGSGLGYFLELWGTTRLCWTYYTGQTPPLFSVLAHGMASVAFWRAGLLIVQVQARIRLVLFGASPIATRHRQ